MNPSQTVRWLLLASVIAILLGPVLMMMAAFSASGLLTGGALLLMGAVGLYAGMRALGRVNSDSSSGRE